MSCSSTAVIPKPDPLTGKLQLQPFNHAAQDLAQVFLELHQPAAVRQHTMTQLQQNALQEWERALLLPLASMRNKYLGVFLSIFDDYFCGGALRGLDDIRWIFANTTTVDLRKIWGRTILDPLRPDRRIIEIVTQHFYDRMWRSPMRREVLHTILHEIVHCLSIFCQVRPELELQTFGLTGHGPIWVQIARIFDRAADTSMHHLGRWDLGIALSQREEREAVEKARHGRR